MSILRQARLDSSVQFHGEALALRAQLALQAEAPAEAETAARAYLADYPLGSQAQDCLLIEGLALRALGSEAAAAAAFENALSMGNDTPSGRLAAAALSP